MSAFHSQADIDAALTHLRAATDDHPRDQCATMIFGGFETTARLLFWASYLLTLDIAEQEHLRVEIAAYPPERVSSLDDFTNWPRLRMTLLETLRLYPPVAHLVREPIADDEIMGEPVKVRSQIWISAWVLHRHRKFWQQPTAFMPERFAGNPSPWTTDARRNARVQDRKSLSYSVPKAPRTDRQGARSIPFSPAKPR